MDQPTVFMFSGQGSHYYQMGRALFEQDAVFRDRLLRLDRIAHAQLQQSITASIYDEQYSKADTFSRTLLTHPAIYMVQCALVASLAARGIEPDYVLGASLGSYVAAAVARVFPEEAGLQFVIQQARALEAHCPPGGMVAVMAPPDLYHSNAALRCVTLAADNFKSHFAVAGDNQALAACEHALRQAGVPHQRLAVSAAFHSPGIDAAEAPLRAAALALNLQAPQLPLVCCAQAAVVRELSVGGLWQVVRRPIRFRESIARLEQQGAWHYVDVGPAGTLAGFVKYNLEPRSRSRVSSIMTPFGQDLKNLHKLCS